MAYRLPNSILLPTLSLLIALAVIVSRPFAIGKIDDVSEARTLLSKNGRKPSRIKSASRSTRGMEPNQRRMVGGYADVTDDLSSQELMEVANFALAQHAGGSSPGSFGEFLAVSPDEVDGGDVEAAVLDAQRQVVAGLNYRLRVAVSRGGSCLGAFEVTVYKPLPVMEQPPQVTSWGRSMACDDKKVVELLHKLRMKEEAKALAVESGIKDE